MFIGSKYSENRYFSLENKITGVVPRTLLTEYLIRLLQSHGPQCFRFQNRINDFLDPLIQHLEKQNVNNENT